MKLPNRLVLLLVVAIYTFFVAGRYNLLRTRFICKSWQTQHVYVFCLSVMLLMCMS